MYARSPRRRLAKKYTLGENIPPLSPEPSSSPSSETPPSPRRRTSRRALERAHATGRPDDGTGVDRTPRSFAASACSHSAREGAVDASIRRRHGGGQDDG